MRTRISGKPKNITKQETRAVLKWMARELCVDRYKTPIFIDLKFLNKLKKKHGYRGSAIWDDDNHRPREFTVEIDDGLSKQLSIITLIHESIHVAQYAKGRLKDLLRGYSLKKWGPRLVDENKITYRNLPWEIEAYSLEKVFFQKWKEDNKKCR